MGERTANLAHTEKGWSGHKPCHVLHCRGDKEPVILPWWPMAPTLCHNSPVPLQMDGCLLVNSSVLLKGTKEGPTSQDLNIAYAAGFWSGWALSTQIPHYFSVRWVVVITCYLFLLFLFDQFSILKGPLQFTPPVKTGKYSAFEMFKWSARLHALMQQTHTPAGERTSDKCPRHSALR